MLQNEDYIEFAEKNSVEVISMSRLNEGVEKEDRKAAQYDAVDADGKPVKYMVMFPGLTLEEMYALNRSPAGRYNQTGKIPYTAIVDPHTLEEMEGLSGSRSAGQLMEVVETHQKALIEKYGPKLSRKDIRAVEDSKAACNELLEKKGVGKALAQLNKDAKKLKKKGERIEAMVEEFRAELMEKAGEELDAVEELIADDLPQAKKRLAKMKSVLRKTPLEERVTTLYTKIKAAAAQ